jgi:hypothetical protein
MIKKYIFYENNDNSSLDSSKKIINGIIQNTKNDEVQGKIIITNHNSNKIEGRFYKSFSKIIFPLKMNNIKKKSENLRNQSNINSSHDSVMRHPQNYHHTPNSDYLPQHRLVRNTGIG